jgi:hypothetical protein
MVQSRLYEKYAERNNDNQKEHMQCQTTQRKPWRRAGCIEGKKEKVDVSVADYKVKTSEPCTKETSKQTISQRIDRQGSRLDTILDTGTRPRG